MLKKILFTFLTLTSVVFMSKAQSVLSTESFDNSVFVPTGWSLKGLVGGVAGQGGNMNLWVRNTNSTSPTANPYMGAGFARFRSRTAIQGAEQQLVSRAIDYSNRGTNAASVSFWMFRDNQNTNMDSLSVWVSNIDSLDGTAVFLGTIARARTIAIPDTQAVNGWYNYTFAIPTSFTGNATTRFIFKGNCENILTSNQGANMYLDEIQFEEFPTPCTGTPNVGTIVNGIPTICGGSGNASLSLSNPMSNVFGISYDWQSATALTGPWTSTGLTTATITPVLTANTYYKCITTCSSSGLTFTTNIDSVIVSTNLPPTISISPSPASVCASDTIGVMISAAGANSYTWSPATGLNATTGITVTAKPTNTTQYTVTGIDSNGCVGIATVNVTVSNPPTVNITASPSDSICSGGQIILNSIQGGGQGTNNLTYLWSDGKTTRRDTLTVTNNMTLSVIVTNAIGCKGYDTITVYALPGQNSNFGWSQNANNTYSFVDSTLGSTSWMWDFGDGNSSQNQNPTYTFSSAGTYQVSLIVVGSCKTDTIVKTITVYPLEINNTKLNSQISCYPNPTNDYINIAIENEAIENVVITNLVGTKVISSALNATKTASISVKNLPAGIYTIQVNSGKKIYSTKFTKQ